MPGLKEAGFIGASAALAGGLAYLIWIHTRSSGEKEHEEPVRREGKPGREEDEKREEDERGGGGGEQIEEEVEVEEVVVVTAAAPVAHTAVNEQPRPAEAGKQVLVLGLDGAGKTSLLHCLATGGTELDVEPTQGFNAVSISKEDLHVELLEIGGREDLRPYWQKYMSRAVVLVFVVDSSNAELFPVAQRHLHELLRGSDPRLPLVVLANKQDLPGACGITDIHDALALSGVGDLRKLFLIGTHVGKTDPELRSGAQDAWDLILQMVCDGR
ncbi:ADP-ribosylation factor-like protein 9 [Genypterus blacodes]|uniref:ADP-ribosylation factor-like protein 9 n=1 Tax=Genypterus blacodes TaxID=154954 RepID=UPI003F75C60D